MRPFKTLLTLACLLPLPLLAALKEGDAFPNLATSAGLEGSLPETNGKLCLVDFWASWCGPCKESFPSLSKIQSDYASRGLTVVGIGVDDKASQYAAFLKKLSPGFATVRDAGKVVTKAVDVPKMPSSYLVAPDGRILAVFHGYHGQETDRQLRESIDNALKTSSSK